MAVTYMSDQSERGRNVEGIRWCVVKKAIIMEMMRILLICTDIFLCHTDAAKKDGHSKKEGGNKLLCDSTKLKLCCI